MSSPSSLCSIFERLSRSSMMACKRSACLAMIRRKRSASCGSFMAPSSRVSTKPLIEVTGVFSSGETLATKSRRMCSSRRKSVTSLSTITWRRCAAGPSIVVQGRPVRLHHALPIAEQHDVGFDRVGTGQRSADEAAQVCIADDFLQEPAFRLGLVQAEQRGRGHVQTDHALLAIDRQHPLGHAGQDRLLLVVVLNQDADLLLQLIGHAIEGFGPGRPAPGRRPIGTRADHWPVPSRVAACCSWPSRRRCRR